LSTISLGVPAGRQAEPQPGLEARQSAFDHGRKLGRDGGALGFGRRQRDQLAVAHMLQHRGGRREEDLDAAGQQIGDRLWAAGVGHVYHLHARQYLEQLAGQMCAGGDAGGCERQLVGLALRQIDQLLDALHADRGMHDQNVGRRGETNNRDEVLGEIEREIGAHRGVDRIGDRPHQQRVAVLGSACDELGGERRSRSGLVLDHDLLAEELAHALPDDARGDVGARSRGETDHDPNRAVRIVVGTRGKRRQQGCAGQCHKNCKSFPHGGLSLCFLAAKHVWARPASARMSGPCEPAARHSVAPLLALMPSGGARATRGRGRVDAVVRS
jgi:hypothetical protein